MTRVRKIIKHRSLMQTEKSQPSGQQIMLETRQPSLRHYTFTPGLGFLCLHQRPMLDYICAPGRKWQSLRQVDKQKLGVASIITVHSKHYPSIITVHSKHYPSIITVHSKHYPNNYVDIKFLTPDLKVTN